MAYQKLRGDQLFDGQKLYGNDVVLLLDARGRKIDILPVSEAGEDIHYLPGAILPGLVNAHCHLELSHLKGRIPEHTGLVAFLQQVVQQRATEPSIIEEAIGLGLQEMKDDGIRAVGDICNTAHTLPFKTQAGIRFHQFIELISLSEAQLETRTAAALQLRERFLNEQPGPVSLSPHAPYTVHPAALRWLNEHTREQLITMHNQETPAENELFQSGTGDFLRLYQAFGLPSSPIPVTGTTSIRAWLPYFRNGQRILLVHNTFMPEEDIVWAMETAERNGVTLYHCFCIRANQYIEGTMPDIPLFQRYGCRIVLGTDSLSSNHSLRLTDEIKTLLSNFDSITLEDSLRWACGTGWEALDMEPVWLTGSAVIQRLQDRQGA